MPSAVGLAGRPVPDSIFHFATGGIAKKLPAGLVSLSQPYLVRARTAIGERRRSLRPCQDGMDPGIISPSLEVDAMDVSDRFPPAIAAVIFLSGPRPTSQAGLMWIGWR